VVIPKEIRRKLGIKEGDRVVFEIDGDEIRIRKVRDFMSLAGTLKGEPLPPEQLREKVEEEIVKDAL
jgi:AbrB family looped-hinge helix DNA binding protein